MRQPTTLIRTYPHKDIAGTIAAARRKWLAQEEDMRQNMRDAGYPEEMSRKNLETEDDTNAIICSVSMTLTRMAMFVASNANFQTLLFH
jgi:hypothetical protein